MSPPRSPRSSEAAAQDPPVWEIAASGGRWLETRHLVTLCAVASERSFRRAAQRLGYTQSAVSQQMAALERRVGARLVERSRAGVAAPTAAGEVLVRHAVEILGRMRVAHEELQGRLWPGGTATIRVATSPGPAAALAAQLVIRLTAGAGAQASWQELGSGPGVAEAVATGAADLAVGQLGDLEHPALRAVGVASVPLYYVWDRKVRRIERFQPALLAGRPLAAYRTCAASRAALASLRLSGIAPEPLVLSDDGAVLRRMIGEGAVALAALGAGSVRPPLVAVPAGFAPAQLAVVRHRDRCAAPECVAVIAGVLEHASSRFTGPTGAVELVAEVS